MKATLLFSFVFVLFGTKAQITNFHVMDQNNTSAFVSDIGVYFKNFIDDSPGYEAPKGSDKNIIFSSAFWFGGTDGNDQLKLAVPHLYNSSSRDLWPGPLTIGMALPDTAIGQTIWSITSAEITDHQAHFQDQGYVMPNAIANWPAHGDASQGFSYNLAPYVDVNGNDVYEPEMGDYPCIKGDLATYVIMNDKEDVHGSGVDPIGLEIHLMFYQYASTDFLNNTTFVDVDIFNRGTQTIYDFTSSFVMDGDLGNPSDDYIGCDSTRSLQYYYNDANDEDGAGVLGYGATPPSFGVVCLNQQMTSATILDDPTGYPAIPMAHYLAMNGIAWGGSPFEDDDSNPTKFLYYDNPSDGSGWSEITAGNMGSDKKAISSVNLNTLIPNDHKSLTYAIIFNQGTSNLESVNGLMEMCDSLQAYYDNFVPDCVPSIAGVEDLELEDNYSIYPNPTADKVNISNENGAQFTGQIISLTGQVVQSLQGTGKNTDVDVSNLEHGMYILQLNQGNSTISKQLIKID